MSTGQGINPKKGDSLSKKTELYERQEKREADRPQTIDGLSFMKKETYDSLPLTRWLDKSSKPIEDHPELPIEHQETTILNRQSGMSVEILLKSKIVRETLKVKSYDLEEVEKGKLRQDLMRLLQKLAHNKHVSSSRRDDELEVTIMRRTEAGSLDKKLIEGRRFREQRGGENTTREYPGGKTQANNATEEKGVV